jgi:outer membrane protein OmpA-like peptidoglycan-associated protein
MATVAGKAEATAVGRVAEGPVQRHLAGSERRGDRRPTEQGLMKDVAILLGSGLVLAALGLGAYWAAWRTERATPAVRPAVLPAPARAPARPEGLRAPAPGAPAGVLHADVFFDVNRSRLSAEAVAVLQDGAARLREAGGQWRVLVQGYADAQGAAQYNLSLARRRAEAVALFLAELGVPREAIRVVTIGPEGSLCEQDSPDCRRLDRRVHVEMRRVEPPAPAVAPVRSGAGLPRTVPAAELLHEATGAGPQSGPAAASR